MSYDNQIDSDIEDADNEDVDNLDIVDTLKQEDN